jgi:hypothetical protein
MSNFSNIGFHVTTYEQFQKLLHIAGKTSRTVEVEDGYYLVYSDRSGAELYTQYNIKGELIGANPHFKGSSRRSVCLNQYIERTESVLDGAFHAWAAPRDPADSESGEYPFVFDLPDAKTYLVGPLPQTVDIQLAAFAQQITVFPDEAVFSASQTSELKFATQSFIPIGLFTDENASNETRLAALGAFTGVIKSCSLKKNTLTKGRFYCMLVDTLGGEVDVVADKVILFDKVPQVGGIVQGDFWLSGKLLLSENEVPEPKKTLFQKLFRSK